MEFQFFHGRRTKSRLADCPTVATGSSTERTKKMWLSKSVRFWVVLAKKNGKRRRKWWISFDTLAPVFLFTFPFPSLFPLPSLRNAYHSVKTWHCGIKHCFLFECVLATLWPNVCFPTANSREPAEPEPAQSCMVWFWWWLAANQFTPKSEKAQEQYFFH